MCIPVPTAPAILSVEYMSVDWMDDSSSGSFQISFGAFHTKVQSIKASHIDTLLCHATAQGVREPASDVEQRFEKHVAT